MSINWRTCFYEKDGKAIKATFDSTKAAEAATRYGILETDFVDITPSNDIENTYHAAYTMADGVISFDPTVGKQLRKTELRRYRRELFRLLDIESIRALEIADTAEILVILTKKQNLRDFPTSTEWATPATVEEISEFMPAAFTVVE